MSFCPKTQKKCFSAVKLKFSILAVFRIDFEDSKNRNSKSGSILPIKIPVFLIIFIFPYYRCFDEICIFCDNVGDSCNRWHFWDKNKYVKASKSQTLLTGQKIAMEDFLSRFVPLDREVIFLLKNFPPSLWCSIHPMAKSTLRYHISFVCFFSYFLVTVHSFVILMDNHSVIPCNELAHFFLYVHCLIWNQKLKFFI